MLKYALLVATIAIAAPALSQTTATSPQTAPTAMPGVADPSMSPAQTAPSQTSAPAQTAEATQPASGTQVAQVVDTEFPTYDTNKDGKLSTVEFAAWMVALKTKTDPTTKATAPETKKWVAAAFAQADTDKNKSLSKPELTSFLSQG